MEKKEKGGKEGRRKERGGEGERSVPKLKKRRVKVINAIEKRGI